MDLIWKVS